MYFESSWKEEFNSILQFQSMILPSKVDVSDGGESSRNRMSYDAFLALKKFQISVISIFIYVKYLKVTSTI